MMTLNYETYDENDVTTAVIDLTLTMVDYYNGTVVDPLVIITAKKMPSPATLTTYLHDTIYLKALGKGPQLMQTVRPPLSPPRQTVKARSLAFRIPCNTNRIQARMACTHNMICYMLRSHYAPVGEYISSFKYIDTHFC
jgi:hypothetical protein